MRTHYPRTPHVPWSPGAGADDVRAADLSGLRGREVVVTEKLDGENTTLYPDGLHARSLDSAHHPSRTWVKALQGRIGARIPAGWRICGENMYARHSIGYDALASWFYGFSVWKGDRCLDWDESVRFLRGLGVPTPPVLWRGTFDERALRAIRLDPTRREGFVVRSVEGFERADFGRRVAKWVRRGHVRTDTHWMHAEVVANGLGPDAALWAVRSGARPDLPALLAALGPVEPPGADRDVVADAGARLDVLGRTGDARLAGVLAAALHREHRGTLVPRLVPALGLPLARRVADLVGLQTVLRRPFPDHERPCALARLAVAADVGVLHAVAAAALVGRTGPEAAEEREQVEWSALVGADADLLGEAPLAPLRARAREAFAGLDSAAADRCWAELREAHAKGWSMPARATRARWSGDFPRLIHLIGCSGSGKSTFARELPGTYTRISLDELRAARGDRVDRSADGEVLREASDRLDAALAAGGTVVWDATSLNGRQRAPVHAVAQRRDALITHAVLLVGEEESARRNAVREHPVPPAVRAAQQRRFAPPYPGQAHRTWYIGASGTIEDVAGSLDAEDP
ncbi:RNA ligase family protein [Embleya scabrispora]|uniref:RNA ligase family protein n=1 Tax=Embleya scabrispora TaxID=159449 RepID=UPI00039EB908|nr:RNA ligase family protein [Embleya scabrispora]MYS85513.1 AAA family ATPase [Streptomyces sp. SID5474]